MSHDVSRRAENGAPRFATSDDLVAAAIDSRESTPSS
jgi:hypothetical protein